MKEDILIIGDDKLVADAFNKFFVNKIENLKERIDKNLIEDPLEKLKKMMGPKNLKFSLKSISHRNLRSNVPLFIFLLIAHLSLSVYL